MMECRPCSVKVSVSSARTSCRGGVKISSSPISEVVEVPEDTTDGSREGGAEELDVDDSDRAGEGDLEGVNRRSGFSIGRFDVLVNDSFLKDIWNLGRLSRSPGYRKEREAANRGGE